MLDCLVSSDDPATREKAQRMAQDMDLDIRPIGWGALAAQDQERVPNSRPWAHLTLD